MKPHRYANGVSITPEIGELDRIRFRAGLPVEAPRQCGCQPFQAESSTGLL